MSNELKNNILYALDVADLPKDLQNDVVEKAIDGIFQSLMIHAFTTLPLKEQHSLMEMLDADEQQETIFSFLETN